MIERNVIITVYANSSKAPASKWAEDFFEDTPIVLNVPGAGGSSFRRKAIQWASTGDLFQAALNELRKDAANIKIKNRGLVTFSVGWSFADELLKFTRERKALDCYILLDGCHTKNLTHWKEFAKTAFESNKFFIMAHSNINPPFISAKDSNTIIFNSVKNNPSLDKSKFKNINIPDCVLNAKLPDEGVKISLGAAGNLPPISKIWKRDALIDFETVGNIVRLNYQGNDRPDHVYIAWHVSERLWMWLGKFWTELAPSTRPEPFVSKKTLAPGAEVEAPTASELGRPESTENKASLEGKPEGSDNKDNIKTDARLTETQDGKENNSIILSGKNNIIKSIFNLLSIVFSWIINKIKKSQ
jgi:hypothetical protein